MCEVLCHTRAGPADQQPGDVDGCGAGAQIVSFLNLSATLVQPQCKAAQHAQATIGFQDVPQRRRQVKTQQVVAQQQRHAGGVAGVQIQQAAIGPSQAPG